ncbi:MAG: hypothetical protein CL489_08440 [Acidobacteria bacterium]|nr:hypothetical protein [Acidobacteriota bacterium]|tara:strand:- start:54431 stop:54706 length:276 start_codon:yes stop_codon:yes gene_type:complete
MNRWNVTTKGVNAIQNMRERRDFKKLREALNAKINIASKSGFGSVTFKYDNPKFPYDSMDLMKHDYHNEDIIFQYGVKIGVGYLIKLTWLK